MNRLLCFRGQEVDKRTQSRKTRFVIRLLKVDGAADLGVHF
jgi:hypothetical protein